MPKVGIIGGDGKMGRWFRGFAEGLGAVVEISDLGKGMPLAGLVAWADVVVLSVPIGVTERVAREVAPLAKPGQLLTDLTSIKSPVMKVWAGTPCEVLSIHPMFAPSVESLRGQTVVMCRGRDGTLSKWLEEALQKGGARLTEASADEHDRMMAVIQGLTHFNEIVLGLALKRMGVSPGESLKFSSPVYRIRLDMMGRILAQDPRLYAEIEALNPFTKLSIKAFMSAAAELHDCLEGSDVEGFMKKFSEAASHLGDFAGEALAESNALVETVADRLRDKR